MTPTIVILTLSLGLIAIQFSPSDSTPSKSNSITEPDLTSLKSLLKSKDLSSLRLGKELELSEDDLKTYVPLAIQQLESELLTELSSQEGEGLVSAPQTGGEHHRAKRTLLLLKKKKLIIAKLLILKALFASGGHKMMPQSGGYGWGPPPAPEPSYGPPPQHEYGPPPQQGYGR